MKPAGAIQSVLDRLHQKRITPLNEGSRPTPGASSITQTVARRTQSSLPNSLAMTLVPAPSPLRNVRGVARRRSNRNGARERPTEDA